MKINSALLSASALALAACSTIVSTAAAAVVSSPRVLVEGKNHYLYDGHELKRLFDMTRTSTLPLSVSEDIDAHGALAYVMGVADAVDGTNACPTLSERSGLFMTVEHYMAIHPEKLSGSAASVVKDALRETYPCPAKEHRGLSVHQRPNHSFKPKPLHGSA